MVTVGVAPFGSAEGLDVVTLKDGSIIHGEVVEMTEGKLRLKTTFGAEEILAIKWADVAQLTTSRPLPFHLKDGTMLMGTVQGVEQGRILFKAEPLAGPVSFAIDSVAAVNPPVKPPVAFEGNFTLGISGASGNSEFKNFSGLAELSGRSEKLRLTLIGRYIYGESNGELAARNARGTVKLDFFITKRFFLYTSAYFEQDTFQDLQLRTALSGGAGYQFIDKGDFASPYVKEMELYGELGLAYFNEDFKMMADQTSTRLRASVKWDWPIFKDVIAVYHYDEMFPSLEDAKDFYITTDQGLVFNLIKNFVTKLQVTYRYNNQPPPGIQKSDTIYLITFGYSLGK
jgi:putative salt-induced outer membrane protein YdiY